MRYLVFLFSFFVLAGCTPSVPISSPSNQTTIQDTLITFSQIQTIPAEQTSPTTHRGYGVLISNAGHLLTAKHLVPDELSSLVLTDSLGQTFPVKQLRLHPVLDLALLQIEKKEAPFLPLYQADDLPTTGYFLSGSATITPQDPQHALLSDKQAAPGKSGSPVRNEKNELIGLITAQTEEGVQIVLMTEQVQQRIDTLVY